MHVFEIISGACWLLWLACDGRVEVGIGVPTRVGNYTWLPSPSGLSDSIFNRNGHISFRFKTFQYQLII